MNKHVPPSGINATMGMALTAGLIAAGAHVTARRRVKTYPATYDMLRTMGMSAEGANRLVHDARHFPTARRLIVAMFGNRRRLLAEAAKDRAAGLKVGE